LEKGDAVFVTQPKIITEMEERIKDESCEKVDSYPAKKKIRILNRPSNLKKYMGLQMFYH
jgi:hypothetical protein